MKYNLSATPSKSKGFQLCPKQMPLMSPEEVGNVQVARAEPNAPIRGQSEGDGVLKELGY